MKNLFRLLLFAAYILPCAAQQQQSFYFNRRLVSANYTIKLTDTYLSVTARCTNTLPLAVTVRSGQAFWVEDLNGNTITVRPGGSDTINSATGDDFVTDKLVSLYVSNGVNGWHRAPVGTKQFPSFNTISDMVASPPLGIYTNVWVVNYATTGDGGGGPFTWIASDTTPTNSGTVFLGTGQASPGRFKRPYSGPVNVLWFGVSANGITDNYARLTESFNVASNTTRQVEFGGAQNGTYVSSGSLIPDGISVDLRGNTVLFSLVGDKRGFCLRNNSSLRNGYVRVQGSGLTASGGDVHAPVVIGEAFGGSGVAGVGYTNVVVDNISVSTSRTNIAGFLICSQSSNIRILNCSTFPTASDNQLSVGIDMEPGTDGNNPPLVTYHPYNISVENFHFRTNTVGVVIAGSLQTAISVSGVYNVSINGLIADYISSGDVIHFSPSSYGFDLASTPVRIGENGITVRNVIGQFCGKNGILIDGFTGSVGGFTRWSLPISLENCKFYGNATNNGIQVARGSDAIIKNCELVNFSNGALVDDYSENIRFSACRLLSNHLAGISVSGTFPPKHIVIDGCITENNNIDNAGWAGINIGQSLFTVVQNCLIGNVTNELHQIQGLRVTSAAQSASIYNNRVRQGKAASSAVGYSLIQAGNFYDSIWEFAGNSCVTGITYRSGIEYLPIRRMIGSNNQIVTELLTGKPVPPSDGTWSQGSRVIYEFPDSNTNVVSTSFYGITGTNTVPAWYSIPFFYNVEDNAAEVVIHKRLRVEDEFALVPKVPLTVTATNQLNVRSGTMFIAGSGGPVTLTNTPSIIDGFEGQDVVLIGTNDVNTVTLQDKSVLAGSNLSLISPTVTLKNGSQLHLRFDSQNSWWGEVGKDTIPNGGGGNWSAVGATNSSLPGTAYLNSIVVTNGITSLNPGGSAFDSIIVTNKITNVVLTASRAVVTAADKSLASSATTSTEIGYVNLVTGPIQAQIDGKQNLITPGTPAQFYRGDGLFTNSLTQSSADSTGPILRFEKQGRAGSATNTPAALGLLGRIDFNGWYGTDFPNSSVLLAYATENWSPTAIGSAMQLFTTANGTTNPTLAFTWDQNGSSTPFSSAAPTTASAGAFAFDNNAWATGRGAFQVFDGTANTYLVGALASDTPTDGQVPMWHTGGTVTWDTATGGVPTSRNINTTGPLSGGGDLSADRTLSVSNFVASGATHASGIVPDPGASSGITKFLREDATWQVPAGSSSGNTSLFAFEKRGTGGDFGYTVGTLAYEKIVFGGTGPTFVLTNAGTYQVIAKIAPLAANSFPQDFYLTNVTDHTFVANSGSAYVSSSTYNVVLPVQITTTGANKTFEIWGETADGTYMSAGVSSTNTIIDVMLLQDAGNTNGIVSLNGLTPSVQTFSASGNMSITSTGSNHAFSSGTVGTIINTTTPVQYDLVRFKSTDSTNVEPSQLVSNGSSLKLGHDAASPVAQTIIAAGPRGGTDSNTAGPDLKIAAPPGTGTGVGGSLKFATSPAGSTGSATNASVTALSLSANGAASLTANSVTVNEPALSVSQLWNGAGVVFQGLKIAVTNTASSGASKLLDIYGGTSGSTFEFSVRSDGTAETASALTTVLASEAIRNGMGLSLGSAMPVSWNSAAGAFGTTDTFLYRGGAAATIQQGLSAASPVDQTYIGPSGVGPDKNGGNQIFGGGQSTGTGTPGKLKVKGSFVSTTGSTANSFTTPATVGGNLKVDTTTTGNVGGGEDSLISYTIPGNQLGVNGAFLEFRVWGSCAANSNTKDIKVYFGSTVLSDGGVTVLNGVSWSAHGYIVRTGAATQTATCELTAGVGVLATSTTTSPAETLSGTVVFKVTGTSAIAPADNDIVQNGMVLNWNIGQ